VFRSSRHLPRVVSALAACAGLAAAAVAQAPPPVFKLLVEEPGVYRVSYEDLVAAGLDRQGIASEGLALTDPAGPVPIWMEDGGDGAFDAGDSPGTTSTSCASTAWRRPA
jgi:hypothetical protein